MIAPTATAARPAIPTPTTAAVATATELPATEAPKTFGIGDTAHWDNGVTVTLYAVERPVPPLNDFIKPKEGHEYMAVEVEECAGPNVPVGEVVGANSYGFTVVMEDNTRYDSTYGGAREPGFGSTDLQANDCVRGWIIYEVPQGAPVKDLQFSYYDWGFEKLITKFNIAG